MTALDFKRLTISPEDMAKLDSLDSGWGYPDIPFGTYEVVPEYFRMSKSRCKPSMVVECRIVSGDRKGQMLFPKFVMSGSYGIHKAKQFLVCMRGADIKFTGFKPFEDVLDKMNKEIAGKVSYTLEYSKNLNGYNTYTVLAGPYEVPSTYKRT